MEKESLRVVSWNLGYWTPAHYKSLENRAQQWNYLMALEPTVALLQECRPSDLIDFGGAAGGAYQAFGTIPRGWTACSAILVRNRLVAEVPQDSNPAMDYLSGYVSRAEVTISPGNSPVRFASVHARAAEVEDDVLTVEDHDRMRRAGCEKAWYGDLVAHELHEWAANRFLVSGDWNTARLFDVTYPGRWPDAGRDFFALLAGWGWDETARRVYGEEIATYRSPQVRPSLGDYQLDHMFTDVALGERLVSFTVDQEVLDRGLSDHAPLIADFV